MSEALQMFEKARADRIVDKNDLSTLLKDLTLEDWRSIAQAHPKGAHLLSDFHVEEKENEFVVHNDRDAINDKKIVDGALSFGRAAVITALGYAAGRLAAARFGNGYLKLAGLGVGLLIGGGLHHSTMSRLKELENTSFPLHVPKDTMPESKTAWNSTTWKLNEALLATAPQSLRHRVMALG